MATSIAKISNVKVKLGELNQKIDEADARTAKAQFNAKYEELRIENADSEVKGYERRIIMAEQQLAEVNTRCCNTEEMLESVKHKTGSVQEELKKLEDDETTGDEKIKEYEQKLKDATTTNNDYHTKLAECNRKLDVTKRDIERTRSKADLKEKKWEELSICISDANENQKTLEQKEIEHAEKENHNLEIIRRLEEEFKEAEARAEHAEHLCKVLKLQKKDREAELDVTNAKIDDVLKEIDIVASLGDQSDE